MKVFVTAAAGGVGTYEYQFFLFEAGVPRVVQPYSQANTWTWDTTGVAAGTYGISVIARSVGSTAASEASNSLSYQILPASAPADNVTLSASPANSATAGTMVFFNAAAGGVGTYEYQFYLFEAGVPRVVQAYSQATSWAWDTTGVVPGTYGVSVITRSLGSNVSSDASNSLSYDVTP
jgi:hypothetical protein